MNVRFEKATLHHQKIIFEWLAEPHIQEFWDNSQDHKDDIINFIHGRKQQYFYGTTVYWIGYINEYPFCFLLTDQILPFQEDLSDAHRTHLSKLGKTISLDFGIGNKAFLGKGLAAPTLQTFVAFYHSQVDPKADTFFIDPDEKNPRAQHVYSKAGFQRVGKFTMKEGAFKEQQTWLMVMKLPVEPEIIQATAADYLTIQNMARFYVYDLSRVCGFLSDEWACPEDGLHRSVDFKIYFEDPTRKAFLVRFARELAGFVLLNKVGIASVPDWNMGEFFILAKFQGKKIGEQVATQIWKIHPGLWEVSVIPENGPALAFWRKTISKYTNGAYSEEMKNVNFDERQPKRHVFKFDTKK